MPLLGIAKDRHRSTLTHTHMLHNTPTDTTPPSNREEAQKTFERERIHKLIAEPVFTPSLFVFQPLVSIRVNFAFFA